MGRGSLPSAAEPRNPPLSTAREGWEPLGFASLDSDPKDLRGRGDWHTIRLIDVHHYTRGEVYVSVDHLISVPDGILFLWAEVRVLGRTVAIEDLLAVAAVNSATGPLVVPLTGGVAYEFVLVQARQIVNGFPSAQLAPASRLSGDIAGRIWR